MASHSSGQVWVGAIRSGRDGETADGPESRGPGTVSRSVAFVVVLLLAIALVAFAFLVRSLGEPDAPAAPASPSSEAL